MKKRLLLIGLIFTIILTVMIIPEFESTQTLSRYGSQGNEVVSIQTKLKNLGYYKGEIDGIFGPLTQSALIQYQTNFGLKADGVAGPKTLQSLGLSTGGYSNSDLELLARCVSAEARGEPYQGQVAVAAVILNRVNSASFPGSIAGVVYQPGAFSSVNDGQINMEPTASARNAAQEALSGVDPSYGSIYFYNPAKSTSKWIFSRPTVVTIGSHIFAK
ncbi:MAG: spore cortex-lytic enzyme [Ruminococcaceae bacterium]|nr:spore cortex-lytic enzyme [Oscillospiraceae bacterium]